MIVMGVAVFLYRDDKSGANEDTPHSWHLFNFLGLGELLVVRFHLIPLHVPHDYLCFLL